MSVMASQITGNWAVDSAVCSGAHLRNHESSALLGFVMEIHRWPVDSPHKGPVTRKKIYLMTSSCINTQDKDEAEQDIYIYHIWLYTSIHDTLHNYQKQFRYEQRGKCTKLNIQMFDCFAEWYNTLPYSILDITEAARMRTTSRSCKWCPCKYRNSVHIFRNIYMQYAHIYNNQ